MTVWTRESTDFLRTKYPNQNIDYMDQRTVDEDQRREGYVPPLERDRLIKKLKLGRALAKTDDMDKDILFMYLREADRAEMTKLRRKYPTLTVAQMERIKAELGPVKR